MLRRPATTLKLCDEEISDLINQLQEKSLQERLKTRVPKERSVISEPAANSVGRQENEKGIPVGLWKNSPIKQPSNQRRDLDQLDVRQLDLRSQLQYLTGNEATNEDNPFYQPGQS